MSDMNRGRRGAIPIPSEAEGKVRPDRIVNIEMEAAEALADLAQLAVRGSGSGSGGEVAGRAGKRVETESPLSDRPVDSVPSCPDLAQDSAVLSLPQHEGPLMAKSEQYAQPLDQSLVCTTSYASLGGGRSRQNLSEAEKEAKRLRRVLANRESARRTIRRRQALCEELTRKAIELTEENEKLKKGKEAALRQFQLLETTNKHLKAEMGKAAEHEMAKAATCKVVGTSKPKHGQTETPASLLNIPMLLPNTLFGPCLWPPIFQSPSMSQPYQVPPTVPFVPQAFCNPDPPHEQSLLSISGPRNPVYILPCPLILTLPNHGHHCESSQSPKPIEGKKPIDDQQGTAASSKTGVSSGKCEPVLPASVEPKGALSTRAGLLDDLNEIPVEPSVDRYGQHVGLHCAEAASEPEQASSTRVETARREGALHSHPTEEANVMEVASPADPIDLTGKEHRESVTCSRDKKTAGSTAAAEARRRRKELTKLKAMHGRQCHTHC